MKKVLLFSLSSLYVLDLHLLENLTKITLEKLIEEAKEELLQQIWIGEYRGSSESIAVKISIVDVNSGTVLVKKQFEASLPGLLGKASRSVLEIAKATPLFLGCVYIKRGLEMRRVEAKALKG